MLNSVYQLWFQVPGIIVSSTLEHSRAIMLFITPVSCDEGLVKLSKVKMAADFFQDDLRVLSIHWFYNFNYLNKCVEMYFFYR